MSFVDWIKLAQDRV